MFLCVACVADRNQAQQQVPPQPATATSLDLFALGTTVTDEGAVRRDSTGSTFRRGGEIYLSVNVSGASIDQQIEVRWLDPAGQVLRRDALEVPVGTRFAAFSTGDTAGWTEGGHRAEVIINGRRVTEREFELL
ncbi:MAG TPA: hypothetical protein VM779_01320 [Thermoanaerobaculia bacterium]|nr:hypothetical protein [Thermoanaerobaculia bacterium]